MAYERRIVHYQNDATTVIQTLSMAGSSGARVTTAWFELLRQGGCGAGEIELRDSFRLRGDIEIGDFIAFEYQTGVRWYFGRVEEVTEESPSTTRVSLYGLFGELNEVFPGGFAGGADSPHRYAYSDYFRYDPDWSAQSWFQVSQPEEIVQKLFTDYIEPNTHITLGSIEHASLLNPIGSFTFRGEESAASIIRSLALAMKGASFGVDANGQLFVTQRRGTVLQTYQEGVDLERLTRSTDRSLMYNRLFLTGDYIYAAPANSPSFYRFQATARYASSIAVHGEKRIRIAMPWIRTVPDFLQFATEFFRLYGNPTQRFEITTKGQSLLLQPWDGQVRLKDRDGADMTVSAFDRIKVQFDHVPIFEITVGPEEIEWPAPPENSRWETPPANAQPVSASVPPLSSWHVSSGTESEETSTENSSASHASSAVASSAASSSESGSEGSSESSASSESDESSSSSSETPRAAIRYGKANDDWNSDPCIEDTVEVTVWRQTGATAQTVICRTPGIDGTGMAGISGFIMTVDGYDDPFFVPDRCAPCGDD